MRAFATIANKSRNFLPGMSLYLLEHDHWPETRRLLLLLSMSILSDFRWFAVRCRSGMETPVDFKLRTMLIETLLPLAKHSIAYPQHTSRILVRPLFTGYLFANFCAANSLRIVVLSRGVLRVVCKKGEPVPVNDAIITSLREHMGPEGFIELCENATVPRDDMQVASDPLQSWRAVFQRQLSDQRRVEILIQTLRELPETSGEAWEMTCK